MKQVQGQLSIFDINFNTVKAELPKVIPIPSEQVKSKQKITNNKNLCPYKKPTVDEIMKVIDKAAYRVDKHKLISDTLECGAIAISNNIGLYKDNNREERYKQIMNSYKSQERELITEIFGMIFVLLTSVVYDDGVFDDYLGELFMRCNQGNNKTGQFFTPYHVSKMMAKMTITKKDIEHGKILTISDCCCGGGGLLIAALDVLKNDYNINYARDCFIEAGDIDARCIHMTYLQLSLAGVPAIIKHQDALSRTLWNVWKTPAYIFQYSRFCKFENLN